ncbi:hypothetical protein OUZ56_007043 [Daphnia magna]|uniref:TGF-beta family profile domain-containing protein n=1 Tax=Daphnia magna TaxID=35525 RepID=A0ABQ9YXG7_9CRUS|nr:hypothetical protein OUZ56_007043 [Daphnia magna]
MALNGTFNVTNNLFFCFVLVLVINVATIPCYSVKCRQNPCSLPSVLPSALGLWKFTQQESTSNDLNPMMNNHLRDVYSSAQDYEHMLPETSIKRKNIPNYMLDIYAQRTHKLATGNSYDNVRNYRAISEMEVSYFESIYQRNNFSIVHHLLFNVSALPIEEQLQEAELKLWAIVNFSPENLFGANRRLFRIYLMNGYNYNPWDLEILDFKFVIESKEIWLTFNVTHAVQWWMENKIPIQMIQVRIDPLHPSEDPEHMIAKRDADVFPDRRPTNKSHRKTKSSPNCRRRPLYVNFTQINYDQWIIAPEGFEAYECAGRCDFPLSDHLTPSKHSILQSLMHAIQPDKVGKVCCVPTRLAPISLLYYDERGILTYKYRYDEMVVAECGCR